MRQSLFLLQLLQNIALLTTFATTNFNSSTMTTNPIKYKSRWDASTWTIISIVMICCIIPCFTAEHLLTPIIICIAALAFIIVAFQSIYYVVDGNQLIVYTFFIPRRYPIDKIKEIQPSNSILSAPATSITRRLAITFTDRKILKSYMPLLISPENQDDFITHLLSINPNIITPKFKH